MSRDNGLFSAHRHAINHFRLFVLKSSTFPLVTPRARCESHVYSSRPNGSPQARLCSEHEIFIKDDYVMNEREETLEG